MDFRETTFRNGATVTGLRHFCLDDMLGCGQAFRWQRLGRGHWRGIVSGLCREAVQTGDKLHMPGVSRQEFFRVWLPYFDLERDYGAVKEILSQNEHR